MVIKHSRVFRISIGQAPTRSYRELVSGASAVFEAKLGFLLLHGVLLFRFDSLFLWTWRSGHAAIAFREPGNVVRIGCEYQEDNCIVEVSKAAIS